MANFNSTDVAVPAVHGSNSGHAGPGINGNGVGIEGESIMGWGVYGHSVSGRGVVAISESDYGLRAHSDKMPGLRASSSLARALEGWGVKDDGVWGISTEATGVHGVSEKAGTGVAGESIDGRGVHGFSKTFQGVFGQSIGNAGIVGESEKFHAIFGVSHDVNNGGVIGFNVDHNNVQQGFGVIGRGLTGVTGESDHGVGIRGKGGRLAGLFEGDVLVTGHFEHQGSMKVAKDIEVTGDIRLLGGNDVAENFSVANFASVVAGSVMTFKEDGSIEACSKSYDKKVAGVISGAGDYKPGLLLGKIETDKDKMPIALMGKVYCWVNADPGPVEVGDLLTTSSTIGHAMKAMDPFKAFGAVIGKALKPLASGKGLIPILVALQ